MQLHPWRRNRSHPSAWPDPRKCTIADSDNDTTSPATQLTLLTLLTLLERHDISFPKIPWKSHRYPNNQQVPNNPHRTSDPGLSCTIALDHPTYLPVRTVSCESQFSVKPLKLGTTAKVNYIQAIELLKQITDPDHRPIDNYL